MNRPNRQLRRQRGGKTDSVDAEAAARAAASGQARTVPKSGVGPVECIRMLLMARRSATKARTQAANQIHSVTVTAPEPLKRQLRGLKLKARVRVCARWRPEQAQTTAAYAKMALRYLARRYQSLDTEIAELKIEIRRLCAEANPAPLAATGVGPDTAATLLVAAGDNPGRMKSEKSFAALCGASPVPASSGQTIRHRLNRGGNRQANNALWPMRYHPDTPRRSHQPIRGTAPRGSKEPKRDHPLPQAAHRPTGLPPLDQPATNPELRPAPPPTPTSPHHRHPNRPTARNPPQPHLSTRTRPRPQPPPRQPIPDLAPNPPTRPLTDLTIIGASMSRFIIGASMSRFMAPTSLDPARSGGRTSSRLRTWRGPGLSTYSAAPSAVPRYTADTATSQIANVARDASSRRARFRATASPANTRLALCNTPRAFDSTPRIRF